MLGVPIEKRLLKRREFEEIVGFGDGFRGPPAIGTILARLYVDISIVIDAVLPSIVAGIDKAVFAAQLEKPLHGVRVLQIRGANEFVDGNAEFILASIQLGVQFRYEYRY